MRQTGMTPAALSGAEDGANIVLQRGTYDIGLECTVSRTYYPSNNDAGEKKIAFFYEDRENLVLDGNGSKLVFHGRITPFVFDRCRRVTLKNFVIDYDRPFFSQGEILACGPDFVELRIDPARYPYRVENEGLVFTSPEWEADLSEGINLFLPFDPVTRAPAYNSILAIAVTGKNAKPDPRSPIPERTFLVKELGQGRIRLEGDCNFNCAPGQVMVITHERRDNNVIFALDCEEMTFENIDIVHGGAMGVLCQTCTDLTLRKIRCGTEKGSALVSLNCDATHFVNCDGKILIEDCSFFNMMDDAVNIHGIYTVVKSVEPGRLVLELKHFQQYRVNVFRAGDEVEICGENGAEVVKRVPVKASRLLSDSEIEILTEGDVSGIKSGDLAENNGRMPEVTVRHCRSGRNRPRGFLISSPKRVVIEDNEFENSSFGLHFTGDTKFWFESTGVRDVLIRGNRFENCGYHYGEAAICFLPEFTAESDKEYFHRNIVIEDNRFETFTGGVLFAKDTENLVFRNNEIVETQAYPPRRKNEPFELVHCRNVVLEY